VPAGAVRRYAQPAARSARFKRDLAALALRTGADRALLRDRITVTGADSIEEHLRRVLDRDLTVSVHIGPARANRKPVLQLLAPDGTTVGFAKLGTNALTRRLVRAETVALTALRYARLSTVVVPRVLHSGQWQGHQVLVQEALPAWRPRRPAGVRLPAAMREVAGALGVYRANLTDKAVTGALASPVIGYGSTRNTLGGRQSIAVGESPDCPRCGNFTIGGNGQLWQLLYAHGIAGTAGYLGFFGYGLWRFRRDVTPVGLAASAAVRGTFVAMFWYNALVTPLAFTMLGYALLWRNGVRG